MIDTDEKSGGEEENNVGNRKTTTWFACVEQFWALLLVAGDSGVSSQW